MSEWVFCPTLQQGVGRVSFKGLRFTHGSLHQWPISSLLLLLHTRGSCNDLSGKLLWHRGAADDNKPYRSQGQRCSWRGPPPHAGHHFRDCGPEKHAASYTRSGIFSGLWQDSSVAGDRETDCLILLEGAAAGTTLVEAMWQQVL